MATVFIQKRVGKKATTYAVKYADPMTLQKQHYHTFKKKVEARQAANELRALLDSGRLPEKKKARFTPLTFGKVADSLKIEWAELHRKNELSDKTYEDYCIWLNVLESKFGKKILARMTRSEITEFRDEVANRTSNVNANKYLLIIKKVCKHGLKLKALIKDPSAKVKLLSEKDHARNNYIVPVELDDLIKACDQVRAKFYMPSIIYLGAEHGAAKQEILSLKWSDINFEFGEIGLINLFRTKNKRERTEFLMPRTKQALLYWKAHLKYMRHRRKITEVKSDHVFCRLDGTPIKCFNKAWWHVRDIAGIKDFHFHDLRHTFCSSLIMSGASLKDAKEMIGHEDISMTDRYSHLTALHKRHKQEQLSRYYQQN